MQHAVTLGLVLLTGCSSIATQLVVTVETDLPPSDIASVEVEVVGRDPFDRAPSTRTFPIGAGSGRFALPFSFGVTPPDGDASQRVEIRVHAVAADGPRRVTVTRTVRTGFRAGQALAVPIFLAAACRDRAPCGPGLTCVDGACVAPDVSPDVLRPVVPGREFDDAGMEDTSSIDAGVGLPTPTMRDVVPLAGVDSAINDIELQPDGDLILWIRTGGGGMLFGAAGTEREGDHVVRISPDRRVRWVRSFFAADSVAVAMTQSGNRVFVCGDFEGTVVADGRTLVAPDDGEADRDDAVYLAELDAAGGTLRWVAQLEAGTDVSCRDLAVSGDVLGVAGVVRGMPPRLDGAAFPLSGCTPASTALLRIDISSTTPLALPSYGMEGTAQGDVAIDDDGDGGFVIGTAFFGSGGQVDGGCGEPGPVVSTGVIRVGRTGARMWGRRVVELTGFSGMLTALARAGSNVIVFNSAEAPSAPSAVLVGGRTVSAASTDARFIVQSVSLATGDDQGRVRVSRGGALVTSIYPTGPDVLLCGMAPDLTYAAPTVDFFGRSVPVSGPYFGYAVALGADFSARWIETVEGDSGGIVTACAPAADGTVWAAGVSTFSGTVFGTAGGGPVLARLSP